MGITSRILSYDVSAIYGDVGPPVEISADYHYSYDTFHTDEGIDGHSMQFGWMGEGQAMGVGLPLAFLSALALHACVWPMKAVDGDPARTPVARLRTAWAVEMAGLGHHAQDLAGRLPMGLRQRLALGCALLHRPDVLFLDEPTSGVDPVGRRELWEIFFQLLAEDRAASRNEASNGE